MIVNAFWDGPIGTMERMAVNSYLRHGFDFHLYTYDPLVAAGTLSSPEGLTVIDAREICPPSKIDLFPWTSIFSDYFRYALLAKVGGWWVDMDTICLQPSSAWPATDYVFARDNIDQYYISGFVMCVPRGAAIVADAVQWIDTLPKEEREKLGHMDIGPYLLQRQVPDRGLSSFVAHPLTFDPIPWNRITEIVDPARSLLLAEACGSAVLIHLRQSIWDKGPNSCAGILADGSKIKSYGDYSPACFWAMLKERYL